MKTTRTDPLVARGAVYFALVFGAGLVLGPIRVLGLVPRVGERVAELIEAPFMLAAIVLAARLVVRRLPARRRVHALGSGLLALGLVLAAEAAVVLALRGLTLGAYLGERDPVAGGAYLALLAAFAVMPWACAGRTSTARRPDRTASSRTTP